MPIPPQDASPAFDTLARMRRCASVGDLDAAIGEALGAIGQPWFSLARFFTADGTPATLVLQGRFEPGWSAHYVQRNYAGSSLIARAAAAQGQLRVERRPRGQQRSPPAPHLPRACWRSSDPLHVQ